ncbi:hypothetical protein SCLCIDRAFT_45039, partial [Scleroderma citrinum Foug A]
CVTGLSSRLVAEWFQHSTDTITKYFKELVHFFSSPKFYCAQVQFPMLHMPISQKILGDCQFKFFDKCIGAVDGSHIRVFASVDDHAFMHNRK